MLRRVIGDLPVARGDLRYFRFLTSPGQPHGAQILEAIRLSEDLLRVLHTCDVRRRRGLVHRGEGEQL